jgi:hypothetical protein
MRDPRCAEALVAAVAGALRDADAPRALASDALAFAQRFGVAETDALTLATPTSVARLGLYRALVHSRFRGALEVSLPRTVAALGDVRLDALVARFLDEGVPRSPYLSDVPRELVAWALPAWRDDATLPAHLGDRARFEVAAFTLAGALDAPDLDATEALDLDRPVVLRGPLAVHRFAFAVHSGDDEPTRPEAGLHLLGYRSLDLEVRWLELSPAAAAIVERLLDPDVSLRRAIAEGCAAAGALADDAALAGTAALLADLAERGVFLGSRVSA